MNLCDGGRFVGTYFDLQFIDKCKKKLFVLVELTAIESRLEQRIHNDKCVFVNLLLNFNLLM